MPTIPDYRTQLAASQEWVASLLDQVEPDQWHRPTPCTTFDVTALVEHMLAVQDRLYDLATRGTVEGSPTELALSTDPAAEFRRLAERAQRAWASWSTADLAQRTVVHPMGVLPGGVIVAQFTEENLVHGWDLAEATGQPSEGPAGLAGPLLAMMRITLPAQRPDGVPFDDAVEPRPDAGPTERLANWMGRSQPVR